MTDILNDLIETWTIHNEIHLYILDVMPEEAMGAVTLLKTASPSRGRNPSRTFAHLHEVRCDKLERNEPGTDGLPRFEGSDEPSREQLREALELSGERVAEAVRLAIEEDRPLKGWKRSPTSWVGYLIAHESHHRGHIAQMFKQSGFRPPQELSYGTWGYWGGYELKYPEG